MKKQILAIQSQILNAILSEKFKFIDYKTEEYNFSKLTIEIDDELYYISMRSNSSIISELETGVWITNLNTNETIANLVKDTLLKSIPTETIKA